MYNEIYSSIKKHYDSVVHNIKSLNTQNSQLIFNYAPMLFANSNQDILRIIRDAINNAEASKTAVLIFQLMKNSEHISNEFIAHDNLLITNPKLEKMKHPLSKLILNVYQTFDLDFRQNNIKLKLMPFDKKILIDYNTFRLALYHIFMNATKYVKSNTSINIDFIETVEKFSIVFSMTSLEINKDEELKIFDDGYSGKQTILLKKNGSGLGMGIIRKALTLNSGKIVVKPGEIREKPKKISYTNNKFIIEFDSHLIS